MPSHALGLHYRRSDRHIGRWFRLLRGPCLPSSGIPVPASPQLAFLRGKEALINEIRQVGILKRRENALLVHELLVDGLLG